MSMKFPLKDKSNILKNVELKSESQTSIDSRVDSKTIKQRAQNKDKFISRSFVSSKKICLVCEKSHKIYGCPKFLQMEVSCLNCLSTNHQAENCKYGCCKKCSSKHNTLLHLGNSNISTEYFNSSNQSQFHPETSREHSLTGFISSKNQVLLSTIKVVVYDFQRNPHICRTLLDSGSQSNFISADLANTLGLQSPILT